jgi:hypothetical protein
MTDRTTGVHRGEEVAAMSYDVARATCVVLIPPR